MDDVLEDELCKIDSFNILTVNKILQGIIEFKNFYQKEIPDYIKDILIKNSENKDIKVEKKYSFLENKNIVLTGTRDIQSLLEDNNVNIQKNVNIKTDFVICKDINSKSSKIEKAEELNIKILDLKGFYNLLKL